MSNKRIDLEHYENKSFERSDLKVLLDEVTRCYKNIDDLKWKHMQVLRARKDLRDEALRLARKLDMLRASLTEEE
jgi:hypothetical protein